MRLVTFPSFSSLLAVVACGHNARSKIAQENVRRLGGEPNGSLAVEDGAYPSKARALVCPCVRDKLDFPGEFHVRAVFDLPDCEVLAMYDFGRKRFRDRGRGPT